MQVTHLDDHITHAIVGPNLAQSFQIAQTAEFFKVLSSSLYSNKILAVVRETLCNAWDAHIEAGCTNKPVEITLTKDKLIIKDFGVGIPKDKIVPIYCTYGGTTKIENENVTGGFGLGCKAPFAYADHFEVTSCHRHHKTIYRLSLSSAQVGGLPSITEIVSIPTTETGLTVTIDIHDYDVPTFRTYINRIASSGEMLVNLNGKVLENLPFSKSEHNFLITRNFEGEREHRVYVRYGNVVYPIYPIAQHDAYVSEHRTVIQFLNMVRGDRYDSPHNWAIIFQALPNSISVTPSRESLSMTDHTIATIKQLLKSFDQVNLQNINELIAQLAEDCISKTFLISPPSVLFEEHTKVPNLGRAPVDVGDFEHLLTSIDIATYLLLKKEEGNFSKKRNVQARLNTWIEAGSDKRGSAKSFLQALNKPSRKRPNQFKARFDWFHRCYLKRILRNFPEELDYKRLYAWSNKSSFYTGRTKEFPAYPIKDWAPAGPMQALPFVRDIVVLAYTRDRASDACHFPEIQHWLGSIQRGCLYYQAPRNPKHVEAARAYFKKLGMTVLDLTIRHPWDTVTTIEPKKKPEVITPRKKGFPKLSEAIDSSGNFSLCNLWTEGADRIETAEFYIYAPKRTTGSDWFVGIRSLQSRALVRLFGDKGIAIRSPSQSAKLNIPEVQSWLPKRLLEEYQNNPLIKLYYQLSEEHRSDSDLDDNKSQYFSLIQRDPVFAKKYKIPQGITQREEDVVCLYNHFDQYYYLRNDADIKAIDTLIKSWDRHPSVKSIVQDIQKSKLITAIDCSKASGVLFGSQQDPAFQQQMRNLILTALKG